MLLMLLPPCSRPESVTRWVKPEKALYARDKNATISPFPRVHTYLTIRPQRPPAGCLLIPNGGSKTGDSEISMRLCFLVYPL